MIIADAGHLMEVFKAKLEVNPRLAAWGTEISLLPPPGKETWKRLFIRYPAVGLYCPGGEYSPSGEERSVAEAVTLAVFCAGQGLRDRAQPFMGGKERPGALALVEECRREALVWKNEGTNLRSISPLAWRQAYANEQIAVCILEVRVEINRPAPSTLEELDAYGSLVPGQEEPGRYQD